MKCTNCDGEGTHDGRFCCACAGSGDEAIGVLRALVKAVGELPENGAGTIQGHDLNQAYMNACALLERHAAQPV